MNRLANLLLIAAAALAMGAPELATLASHALASAYATHGGR